MPPRRLITVRPLKESYFCKMGVMLATHAEFLCYSLAPSLLTQFRTAKPSKCNRSAQGQVCRKGSWKRRQAVIARIDANQAEASCKICKNCAIVLGLAGDDESGFTPRLKCSHLCGNQPSDFRSRLQSKRGCKIGCKSGRSRLHNLQKLCYSRGLGGCRKIRVYPDVSIVAKR